MHCLGWWYNDPCFGGVFLWSCLLNNCGQFLRQDSITFTHLYVCMLYDWFLIDLSYGKYVPFAYFQRHRYWKPMNTWRFSHFSRWKINHHGLVVAIFFWEASAMFQVAFGWGFQWLSFVFTTGWVNNYPAKYMNCITSEFLKGILWLVEFMWDSHVFQPSHLIYKVGFKNMVEGWKNDVPNSCQKDFVFNTVHVSWPKDFLGGVFKYFLFSSRSLGK